LKRERVTLGDYRALSAFRFEIRRFLAFSEQVARGAGVEPQQHQLLLALAGLPRKTKPNIRALAERLCVQHHTAVELIDKLEARGFVRRERSANDKREVLLILTAPGRRVLRQLSREHRAQLQSVGPHMVAALQEIVGSLTQSPSAAAQAAAGQALAAPAEPEASEIA
jgi:DNA-binding MarR family transcriptional regulator